MKKLKLTAMLLYMLTLASCGLNLSFSDPTTIVNTQTDIALKISNHEEFNIDEAISSLQNEVVMNLAKGINPASNNNIAIRNHLILAMLHYLNGDKVNYENERDTAILDINYNLINDSVYSEGPSYYLYIEEILNVYRDLIGPDEFLDSFRNKCTAWYSEYIMPDGTLPPIGDTRRYKYGFIFSTQDRVVYDSEETLIKKGDVTLFVRHPTKINKYKLNDHVHYDIGDFCVYYKDKCVVFPVGYPGTAIKEEHGLSNLQYKNSLYVEELDASNWRLKKYEVIKIEHSENINDTISENSVYLMYKIYSKVMTRKITVCQLKHENRTKVVVEDYNSSGINLNLDTSCCKINVIAGYDIQYGKGYHCDNLEDVIENNRIFIENEFGDTKVELEF